MRKTLMDLAKYLKGLMPEIEEAYAVGPAYTDISTEDTIREGVLAFRAFLDRLYDFLSANGASFDYHKKIAHEYENRTGISVYYPFLHTVKTLLLRMGYHGVPSKNAHSLACGNAIFDEKLSVSKNLECLRFLTKCGICIDGVDVNAKKQNLSAINAITVTYPDNPAMLTGLRVMAIAEVDHGTLVNQDIFLRCDYRALKKNEPDVLSIVQDTIRPLSADVRDFVLRLHHRHVDNGLACSVEIKGLHVYIRHCCKRKDVWGINASLNNGYHINVKAANTDKYPDTVKAFPPFLREMIAKGYGCGRKREIGRCDGGCRGLPLPLDDSVMEIRDDIVRWLDQEVACLRKK